MQIGQLLLDTAFNGDIQNAQSRNPFKTETFKKIAEHPGLKVDARTLGSWVRAAAIRAKLVGQEVNVDRLGTSHFVELGLVKDDTQMIELAEEANSEQLSVRQLRQKIQDLYGKESTEMDKVKMELNRLRFQIPQYRHFDLSDLASNVETLDVIFRGKNVETKIKAIEKSITDLETFKAILTKYHKSLKTIAVKEAKTKKK
jgi:hypothetical protein